MFIFLRSHQKPFFPVKNSFCLCLRSPDVYRVHFSYYIIPIILISSCEPYILISSIDLKAFSALSSVNQYLFKDILKEIIMFLQYKQCLKESNQYSATYSRINKLIYLKEQCRYRRSQILTFTFLS